MKAKLSFLSFLFALIGLVAGTQLAAAADDAGTLIAGAYSTTCGAQDQYELDVVGFESGLIGSYSPTGLTGGESVYAVFDQSGTRGPACPALGAYFIISTGSDVGSTWLTSVTCNGMTLNGSDAKTYEYNGGLAESWWIWPKTYFNLSAGGTYSCTVNHN
jgi:hypothetical protein